MNDERWERTRGWWPHVIAVLILVGGFYALVIYPYVLDDLVKGAIINMMGAAVLYEFGSATSATTARQQQSATAAGVVAAMTPSPSQASPMPVEITEPVTVESVSATETTSGRG